jgi:hypothetical protein
LGTDKGFVSVPQIEPLARSFESLDVGEARGRKQVPLIVQEQTESASKEQRAAPEGAALSVPDTNF